MKSTSTARRVRQSHYLVRCYISKSTLKSCVAVENMQRVCKPHLHRRYHLQVIDVHDRATLTRDGQIVAAPTLIKRLPRTRQRLFGDMSDLDGVLLGLDVRVQGA